MASMNTKLNIEKLDGNIVQKHGELQGAQGDREAEVYQVSNDDTIVAQRWLEEKQLEEKTNTDCLVKDQEKEYHTGWKIKMSNALDSCNQRSTQQCMKSEVAKHLGVAWIQQQNVLVDETNMTHFAKIRCFLIQSVCLSYREDSNEAAFVVAAVDKIYAHELLTFNNTVACEVIFKWEAGLKDDMDARSDAETWVTKGLLVKAKGNVLGLEIIRDHSGNTLRVSQSRIHNEKLVQTLLKGHSTL
ncbi:hypothetical protein Tco_1181788 [Tanacetum coccineum]